MLGRNKILIIHFIETSMQCDISMKMLDDSCDNERFLDGKFPAGQRGF